MLGKSENAPPIATGRTKILDPHYHPEEIPIDIAQGHVKIAKTNGNFYKPRSVSPLT